jgi:signal transduction histidine kinase
MFKIDKCRFNINTLIEEIQDIFEYPCEQKGIKLTITKSKDVENMKIYSDEKRIKHIICNLMANAVKFTFRGNVTITIQPFSGKKIGEKL